MLVAKTPIYIANFPVDMRKSIDGLMLLAETHFSSNVTDGAYPEYFMTMTIFRD